MNEVLDSRFAEVVHRLAVGIEPRDAVRAGRIASPLELRLLEPPNLASVRLVRHPSTRWAVRYVPRIPGSIDVLIDDPLRRYVPRRMRFPVTDLALVRNAERAGGHFPASQRTWRPALFPAAAYPLTTPVAVIRGRARRAGGPARWVRVTATARGTARILGRAHGDDRGEFLLVVAPDPAAPAELPARIGLTITVRARRPAPVAPAGRPPDPFWDLPLEPVEAPGPDDAISAGLQDPAGYEPGFTASRDVDLVPGRALTGVAPFDLA